MKTTGRILKFHGTSGHLTSYSQYDDDDDYAPSPESSYQQELHIHGIIGVLEEPSSSSRHLFYIKERRFVGVLGGANRGINNRGINRGGGAAVYQIIQAGSVQLKRKPYLTLWEEARERKAIEGILKVCQSGGLFFSYECDLTVSRELAVGIVGGSASVAATTTKGVSTFSPDSAGVDSFGGGSGGGCGGGGEWSSGKTVYPCETARDEFWWNRHLLDPLMDRMSEAKHFILPIICGYVGHFPYSLPLIRSLDAGKDDFNDDDDDDDRMGDDVVDVDVVVIGRMSRRNVGTRYHRRGLDADGNAAMFVETEVILHSDGVVMSHCQVRGSVPWLWSQVPDVSYRPPINLEPVQGHNGALQSMHRHFQHIEKSYIISSNQEPTGMITCVNLLNKIGHELELGQSYDRGISLLQKSVDSVIPLNYYAFDLNPKSMKYGQMIHDFKLYQATLGEITELAAATVSREQVFCAQVSATAIKSNVTSSTSSSVNVANSQYSLSAKSKSYRNCIVIDVLSEQSGVTRTNCLDCLDRTNMIQFVFSSQALTVMLEKLSFIKMGVRRRVSIPAGMNAQFKELWIEHGNALARLYAGTGALHSTFIRNHVRSNLNNDHSAAVSTVVFNSSVQPHESRLRVLKRKVKDGVFALTRFYLNNFTDSYRQDSFDTFLGYGQCEPAQLVLTSRTAKPAPDTAKTKRYTSSWEWLADSVTMYLELAIDQLAPKSVDSYFDHVMVLLWLAVIMSIYTLLGRPRDWKIIRKSKNQNYI